MTTINTCKTQKYPRDMKRTETIGVKLTTTDLSHPYTRDDRGSKINEQPHSDFVGNFVAFFARTSKTIDVLVSVSGIMT